jgi:gamma-glutamyl-gamma-aminobutyrate hydrolase PuuD
MFLNRGWAISFDLSQCDLICFTGGADVSPFLYGERPLPDTHFSSSRDNKEITLWKSKPPKFPKVGICRGAQLGNVLCGGSLWQDVNNHNVRHPAKDHSGLLTPALVMVSSVHHQMCRLTSDALLLASSNRALIKKSEHETKNLGMVNGWEDPEAFFYDNFNFLGVQFHPEYTGYPMAERCTNYFFMLLDLCFDFEDDDERLVNAVQEVPRDERGIPVLG